MTSVFILFFYYFVYHCGSTDGGWSPVFLFTTPPAPSVPWAPRLLVYGDMGSVNAQSLPRMEQKVARGDVDPILHVGDSDSEATKPEARSQRPWIVAFGHRPMYCSNGVLADCNNYNSRVRTGIPVFGMFGLEDLFYDYGVDMVILGHERTWPLYNNGSLEEPYRNPNAPVHIITGSAIGNHATDKFRSKEQPAASVDFQLKDSVCGYFNMKILLPLIGLFFFCHGVICIGSLTPQQVHLALGDNQYEMTVTWNTVSKTKDTLVEYGVGGLKQKVAGNATRFEECKKHPCNKQYVHRVRLLNLTPASTYMYHCGSTDGGWSPVFLFTTPPAPSVPWAPRLLVYGDMGSINAQSLPRMEQEVARGDVDAILHVGDFAYDMDSENGAVGDEFMRQIESLAAYVPYMTCPGNHEEWGNFSEYRSRFSMPGGTEGLMYSFNLGPVHFISISTEFYYFLQYGIKLPIKQYDWLIEDLKEATKPEARSQRPWIVAFGHRPMYCSNGGLADCNNYNSRVRTGIPVFGMFGLEDLFYDYGVDMVIWGHEHSYERTWPLYNHTVYNGSLEEPYRNPKAPVHIITGSAGCKERIAPFVLPMPDWSAFRNTDYGYTRVHFQNNTHVHIEQVSDDKGGEVVDSIWLIKDRHGSYKDM